MSAGWMVKQFLIDTTKTVGQTADITDAAILEAPKAILFFASGPQSGHEGGGSGDGHRLIGWATDTTEGGGLKSAGLVARSAHNVATSFEKGYNNNGDCLNTLGSAANVVDGRAKVSAMLSNGFRLTYDEQFSLALSVMAVVIWGTDISNIEYGTFQAPITGSAPFTADYGPAFACEDKKALLLLFGSLEPDPNSHVIDSDISIGVAVSAGEQACLVSAGDDARVLPSTVVRRHASRGDQCYATFFTGKGSLNRRAAFNSWLPTGGFRLTWNLIAGNAVMISWIVIKGGNWSVKSGTCPALGVGDTVDVTGAGFDPVGGLTLSHGAALNSTLDAHSGSMQDSWGAFDGTRDAAYAARNLTDQAATTLVAGRVEPDESYIEIGTDGSLAAAMSATLITDGIRYTVDVGDPETHQFVAVMFGPSSAPPPVPIIHRMFVSRMPVQQASRL